jgi:hypothetical protein
MEEMFKNFFYVKHPNLVDFTRLAKLMNIDLELSAKRIGMAARGSGPERRPGWSHQLASMNSGRLQVRASWHSTRKAGHHVPPPSLKHLRDGDAKAHRLDHIDLVFLLFDCAGSTKKKTCMAIPLRLSDKERKRAVKWLWRCGCLLCVVVLLEN